MKKYRFPAILLLLSLLLTLLPMSAVAAEDELDLYCTNAVLVDANYDEVLYEKNAYDKAYPASMTKVMTALLTLEALEKGDISLDTMVTVRSEEHTSELQSR